MKIHANLIGFDPKKQHINWTNLNKTALLKVHLFFPNRFCRKNDKNNVSDISGTLLALAKMLRSENCPLISIAQPKGQVHSKKHSVEEHVFKYIFCYLKYVFHIIFNICSNVIHTYYHTDMIHLII